ncbi:MAG TPA: hypothetical protein PLD88_02295, partial [Candidatus Berkiella sp.]|nr:hypothetical protein [Candidatus Berkiella sp.]
MGEDASFEAKINERLGRLLKYYRSDDNWDHLLLSYIDGRDIDKVLQPHLATPPMDDIGCALFEIDYLQNPYSGFASGLERNINIAIELIKEQETLYKKHIIHNDVQLANYILTEKAGKVVVTGIDFGVATDLSNVNNPNAVLQENIASLQEALKALLPQENYLKMRNSFSKKGPIQYSDMVVALQK